MLGIRVPVGFQQRRGESVQAGAGLVVEAKACSTVSSSVSRCSWRMSKSTSSFDS
jgi:hypothetical protein